MTASPWFQEVFKKKKTLEIASEAQHSALLLYIHWILRHRDIHQYTATSETALTALNK
jgi:hypothetical protein